MYINKSFLIPELTGFFFVDILKWRSLSCVTAVWADCKAAIRDWGLFIVVFLLTDDGRESSQRNNRMACLRSVQLLTESHLIYLMWFCEQRLVLQQRRWKGSPPPLQWEDCAGGQVSGDLWEQACRKPIWAGNGEEFMRAVLEWIETCRRRIDSRPGPSAHPPLPLCFSLTDWWQWTAMMERKAVTSGSSQLKFNCRQNEFVSDSWRSPTEWTCCHSAFSANTQSEINMKNIFALSSCRASDCDSLQFCSMIENAVSLFFQPHVRKEKSQFQALFLSLLKNCLQIRFKDGSWYFTAMCSGWPHFHWSFPAMKA